MLTKENEIDIFSSKDDDNFFNDFMFGSRKNDKF